MLYLFFPGATLDEFSRLFAKMEVFSTFMYICVCACTRKHTLIHVCVNVYIKIKGKEI